MWCDNCPFVRTDILMNSRNYEQLFVGTQQAQVVETAGIVARV